VTVYRQRAAASTIAALRLRIRRAVGDIEGDASPTAPRWSDTAIDQAAIDQMFDMYSELAIDPSRVMQRASLTYTADAASVALGETYAAAPIVMIEEVVANSRYPLARVDYLDIEKFGRDGDADVLSTPGNRVWSFFDNGIAVRPTPNSNLALEVSYIGNPLTLAGASTPTTDQQPLPVEFEPVLVLGAALNLLEVDDQTPMVRMHRMRYERMWERFQLRATQYRGPIFCRNIRRFT